MNNAEKFEKCFGIYATELLAMPEQDFLKWISDEAKEKQWIPCEERLPEEYGEYLVTMNDGSVQECGYIPENNGDALTSGWNTCESTGFVFIDEWDVIAWMPLPKPYGGERKDYE